MNDIIKTSMAARRDSDNRATAHPIWLVQRQAYGSSGLLAWDTVPLGYYFDAASAQERHDAEARKHGAPYVRIYVDALSRSAGALLDAVDALAREVDA